MDLTKKNQSIGSPFGENMRIERTASEPKAPHKKMEMKGSIGMLAISAAFLALLISVLYVAFDINSVRSIPQKSGMSGFQNPTTEPERMLTEDTNTVAEPVVTVTEPTNTAIPAVSKDVLLGKYNPGNRKDFALISTKYTSRTFYMNKEAYEAYKKMYDAAAADGIKLSIISATRSYSDQKSIWEAKWNGSRAVEGKNLTDGSYSDSEKSEIILRFSSMPGTSRHHWGTDVDLNSLENGYFASGDGKKIYSWLSENASKYGFGQPYTPKPETREKGYEEEKWHWSYLPLSKQYLRAYMKSVTYSDIEGFSGSGTAESLDVIRNYVYSINPDCR